MSNIAEGFESHTQALFIDFLEPNSMKPIAWQNEPATEFMVL
jgi:hypothetical protein